MISVSTTVVRCPAVFPPAWIAKPEKKAPPSRRATRKSRKVRRAALEQTEDIALLREVLTGDDVAWKVFHDRFRNLILACVSRVAARCGAHLGAADRMDVVSEVHLNLVKNDFRRLRLYRIDGGCSVSSWVGVIASSTTQDFLRRERRRRTDPMLDADLERLTPPVPGPDFAVIDREERQFVDQALSNFSERDRNFVELYFLRALEPQAIADEMGVSVSTVYSKKAKIKTKLQRIAQAAA